MGDDKSIFVESLGWTIFGVFLMAVIPAVFMGVTVGNSDRLSCPNGGDGLVESIGISNYMIIYGSVGIFWAVFFPVSVFCRCWHYRNNSRFFVGGLRLIMYIFTFTWLIVGCVLFWRDCPEMEPKVVRDTFWFYSVVGLVGIFFGICTAIKKMACDDFGCQKVLFPTDSDV
jgi:hypothetical protein